MKHESNRDKVKIDESAISCHEGSAHNAIDNERKTTQNSDIRRSILRQPSDNTRSSLSVNNSGKPNHGARSASVVRQSIVTWANSVMKKNNSTLSIDSSEPKSRRSGFWTRLAKNKDIWSDVDGEEEVTEDQVSYKQIWDHLTSELLISWRNVWKTVTSHPYIPFATLLCLIALLVVSITTTNQLAKVYRSERTREATDLALTTGRWFFEELNKAIFPLFAMREFVKEMPIFHNLPYLIGQGGENGSAPYINATVIKYRNVSGICDNSTIQAEFDRIAKSIKENSNMNGVLVSLNISPYDVACYFYPLNNTADFTPPLFLDNSGAVGQDLLKDPTRVAILLKTHASGSFTVAGPMTLAQCSSGCPPAVKTGFIARLPVDMPGYNINAGGVNYSSWGFVAAVINWEKLLNHSNIYHRFEDKGIQFQLTKTDRILNTSSNQFYEKTSVLAESKAAESIDSRLYYNVSLAGATQSNWTMSVAYSDGFGAPWYSPIISVCVILSIVLSLMVMLILIEKQQHKNLLHEMLPAKALKKLEKQGVFVKEHTMVTIFFSDIVGYTSMSADMRPIQVMKMLNSFYTEADRLATKNKVYKIKTIGDAYMCVGGCPDKCSAFEGAERVALFALDLMEFVKRFRTEDGSQISLRAGIHSGAVVAGVIEKKRPQYTIFGDAVNVASSMESSAEAMKIQCSHVTSHFLKSAPNYRFSLVEKSVVELPDQGQFNTYVIEGASEYIE